MTLSSQKKTQIIEERVRLMHERIPKRAAALNEDGHLPGTIFLPGPQRLDKYWQFISLNDAMKCLNPHWEDDIKMGLDPVGPESPYLKNLLRVPGLFKKTTADFVRLNAQYADRYQEGSNATVPTDTRQPEPVPPGGGPVGYG